MMPQVWCAPGEFTPVLNGEIVAVRLSGGRIRAARCVDTSQEYGDPRWAFVDSRGDGFGGFDGFVAVGRLFSRRTVATWEIDFAVCAALSAVGCYALDEEDVSDSLANLLASRNEYVEELRSLLPGNRERIRDAIWRASCCWRERSAEEWAA